MVQESIRGYRSGRSQLRRREEILAACFDGIENSEMRRKGHGLNSRITRKKPAAILDDIRIDAKDRRE